MTRHQQRNPIRRASSSTARVAFGLPISLANCEVAPSFAARNLPQCLPHAQLKNRPAQIEFAGANLFGAGIVWSACAAGQVVPSRTLSSATSTRRESKASRRRMAAGNSARRLDSASAEVEPSDSQHSPRGVAPTITQPKGVRAVENEMCSPLPPCANRDGVMPNWFPS